MKCNQPLSIWPHRSIDWIDAGNVEKPVSVPCGKCLPCLSNRRNDWSFRLQVEWKHSLSSMFVTLTYHPKFLPYGGSLKKRDLQLFMKRLRKRDCNSKLRYYAVGEYGSKTARPHYHLLLFNCSDEKYIRSSWQLGQVHIGKVSLASVAYCTKYIVQPPDKIGDLEKPFAVMSRSYGIGGKYLTDQMIQWHRQGHRNYAQVQNVKCRLPRFYKDRIFYGRDKEIVSDLSKWRSIKNERQNLRLFKKKFGRYAKSKLTEHRNAVILGIRKKVAFTQHL